MRFPSKSLSDDSVGHAGGRLARFATRSPQFGCWEGCSRAARAEDGVAISDKTLWEIAMMVSKRMIHVNGSMIEFLRAAEAETLVLPVDSAIAERSMTLSPRFPKDPSDRIIAATALVHGIPLVTSDAAIRKSGEVPCIW